MNVINWGASAYDFSICFLKSVFIYFLKFYLFRERGREGEREGEKHQRVVAFHEVLTGDLAHNPGI